uniref:sn-1-specific diacylglycerol lipase n=1 Tax=Ascaris suum TaxID=6253 RepID=F1KT78_ASCSU
MPSLVAFGRRWNIASDDFVFPALSEAFIRFAWVVSACVIFVLNNPLGCPSWDFVAYLFLLLGLNVVTLLWCIALAYVSSRGSILEPRPRRHVATLLYIRLPLFLVEFICTVVSTLLAFESNDLCHLVFGVRVSVLLQWALILSVFFGVAIVFNPSGDSHIEHSLTHERRSWTRRLKLCSIGQDELMRTALDDIATLVASFFADVDLVASDVLAGLFLFAHSPGTSQPPRTPPPITQAPTWMTIENARRMMEFATAVYGWPAYMLNNCGCCAWWRLCTKLDCCKKCRCNEVLIVEDNCCLCGTASFVLVSNCPRADIFFISFRNRLYQVPFVVLADPVSESIVITIRGSASLMDLVTDLSLDDEVFSVDVDTDPILRHDQQLEGSGEEVRVHRGMLRSARYVLDTLKEHNVLEDLRVLYPNYGITVCGHSLGAGVATLLTLLLKQSHSSIRCFAFSPPGCVISESGLPETEELVFSIVVGDDIVPRLSYQTLHKLKYGIIDSLLACNSAKCEILIKGCFRLFFSSPWQFETERAISVQTQPATVPVNDRLPLIFHHAISASSSEYGGTESDAESSERRQRRIQLHPPGRLLHLCVVNGSLVSKWIHHSALDEIKLSGAVITDHMPYYVRKILLMDTTLPDV